MPYLTQLARVARRTGFPVVEVAGWESRGHGPQPSVQGIVCHHTAGRDDMHIVRDGRPGLDGPLSQIWLRHDGTIFVVAAGRCWHNAPSTSRYHTNSASIGIEAENDGKQPWPAIQLDAYRRLCAELCREFNLPASRVKAHREVNTSKPDPHSINMADFRNDVAGLLRLGPAEVDFEPANSWTEDIVKDLPTLKIEARNYDVKTVRGCLFARGDLAPTRYGGTVGLEAWLNRIDFDAELDADVRLFQKTKKLTVDGVVGPKTWGALLRVS